MSEIYFDNSATTRCYPQVAERMMQIMTEEYGNPSSMHKKGFEAEQYVKEAKELIAKNLKVNEKEILFTSGGTESDNLAIIGSALANHRAGNHIITTSIEHPAVKNTVKHLEEQGFRITMLPVDQYGVVKMDAFKEALCEDTILVSIMYVNNEVGARQPIEEIAAHIKETKSKALFHVDAVQGYGKYRIFPKKMGIDMLSVSGHKIHGPKGIGFLYIRDKVKIKPITFGGGQQGGIRSGTENVPGIAGIAEAVRLCYDNFDEKIVTLYERRDQFVKGIESIEGCRINGMPDREGAPHIVSVTFEGVRSEVLLHALEDKNIYVSAGSACASNKPEPSATLLAMGLSMKEIEGTIRFSFSFDTTAAEITYCIESLQELLPRLRKYTRK